MKKDYIALGLSVLMLTLGGEALLIYLYSLDPFPVVASEQAHIIDEAFNFLTMLAMPIIAFVATFLVYSVIKFRRKNDDPDADGEHITGSSKIVGLWLVVTSFLCLFVIIHPGITGINELKAREVDPDVVIQVTGMQFTWIATYPDQGITTNKIVLPVGKRIRFDIYSTDVLHSFWIPVFREKMDAVPGRVTRMHVNPTVIGSYDENRDFRVQCAELCGVNHNLMQIPVEVVSVADYENWINEMTQ